MKTVVSRTCGQLGNFMFQVATGKAYAEKYGADFFVQIADSRLHNSQFDFITKRFPQKDKVEGGLCRIMENSSFPEIMEDRTMLFSGYFQNEKNFTSEQALKWFGMTDDDKKRILEKYGDLSDCVSISVRHKNDYRRLAPRKEWYGAIYNKYFNGQRVFITGDDMQWIKENLKDIPNAIFSEGGCVADDLYGCSLCKDHITYNGTFGWWGAYLGEEMRMKEGKETKVIISGDWGKGSPIRDGWIIDSLD